MNFKEFTKSMLIERAKNEKKILDILSKNQQGLKMDGLIKKTGLSEVLVFRALMSLQNKYINNAVDVNNGVYKLAKV